MQSDVATVGQGVELAYDRFGRANAPLILLLSGAGAPRQFWPEEFCQQLADLGFCVVRFDHRDTGFSTHFDTAYDIHALLDDAMDLLDRLGAAKAHWVGHSMGGFLVQIAMCKYPQRLISATSISAGSFVSEALHEKYQTSQPTDRTWEVLLDNQPKGDFETDFPGWYNSWRLLHGRIAMDDDLVMQYTRALYAGDSRNAQVAKNHVQAMTTVPATLIDELAESPVPLLVLHGTDDLLVPCNNGEVTATLAQGTFKRIQDAGHMFFNHELWRFIATTLSEHLPQGESAKGT